MPEIDGIEVIRHLAKLESSGNLLLMSGYDRGVLHSAETLAKGHGLNVIKNLTKPISTDEISKLFLSLANDSGQNKFISGNKGKASKGHDSFVPDERDLRKAIETKELVLYYQPQIEMKTGMLSGVEALVRWLHPEYGLIYPDKFIALAERTGLIEQLTEEVIHLAIAQSLRWQNTGKPIKISINIGTKHYQLETA